jgi:hypothetical protein
VLTIPIQDIQFTDDDGSALRFRVANRLVASKSSEEEAMELLQGAGGEHEERRATVIQLSNRCFRHRDVN